jgi:transmembrane sensor
LYVFARRVRNAAVWIARLHGPDRSTQMERECLAWQARSEAHRVAFERCTDTWQDVAGVGERRTVLLMDGTRMSLNTSTRVRVALAPAQRTVRVEEGEALFEVARMRIGHLS